MSERAEQMSERSRRPAMCSRPHHSSSPGCTGSLLGEGEEEQKVCDVRREKEE